MTVASETSRVSYTGAGTTGPFSVPFYFLEDDDLKVVKTEIATGVETDLVLTTDYTVSGAGDPAGGTVTLVAAVLSTHKIVIIRDPDLLQQTDYPDNDPFPAQSHEKALDKLTMVVQRLKDLIGRAFTLSDGVTGSFDLTVPPASAGKALKWNATADGLENSAYDPDEQVALAAGYASDANDAKIAAAAAEAAAAAILSTFDNKYLGSKASAPTLDNEGNPLQDGALYYDTTLGVVRVYGLGTTTWISLPVATLASLTDVTLASLATGDALVWDGAEWVNTNSVASVAASQAEMEAGAVTALRSMSPLRVKQAINALSSPIPSGTLMLFQQTSAPTGWTKETAHNDKALRVVSGTASSGGTSAFSTVFGKTATDGHTLTIAQMPSHSHSMRLGVIGGSVNVGWIIDGATSVTSSAGVSAGGSSVIEPSAGSGNSHSHGMDIRVQYVDLIIAAKD